MILPLGDSPNSRETPYVTYALVALNVAIFALVNLPLGMQPVDPRDPQVIEYARVIAETSSQPVVYERLVRQMSAYDLFIFENGFRAAAPSLRDLFLSIFLHAGLVHLFGNMLFLWIYGDNVEHRLGRIRYLGWYVATGVIATLFHAMFAVSSPLPLIGASGAISGVLGFYFLWFPKNQVRLFFFLFPFFMDVIVVRARLLLGFYLIADNLLPFLLFRGEGGGVAHGAHIGGFLAGLVGAWLRGRPSTQSAAEQIVNADGSINTASVSLTEALTDGRLEDVAKAYLALSPSDSENVLSAQDALRLGRWLQEQGHVEGALVVFRRLIRDHPQGPTTALAHLGAGMMQLELGQPTAANQHFLEVLEHNPTGEVASRARNALEAIATREGYRPGMGRIAPG